MDKYNLPTFAVFIENSESYSSTVYKCSRGYNTIGIGRNLDANPLTEEEYKYFSLKYKMDKEDVNNYFQRGITRADAEYLLNNDVMKCKEQIKKLVPYLDNLPTYLIYVLLDITFNMGINSVKGFKLMFKALDSYYKTKDVNHLDMMAVELLHCGYPKGYLFDVKTRAVRNAKLLCNNWQNVKSILSARKKTEKHMEFILKYDK